MPSAEKIHELLAKCDRARDGAIQSARRIVKRGLAKSLERLRGATNRRRFHRPLPFCPGEEFEQFFRVVVGSALKKRLQGDVAQEGAAFVAAACK